MTSKVCRKMSPKSSRKIEKKVYDHPLMTFVAQGPGMRMDTIHERLKEEGYNLLSSKELGQYNITGDRPELGTRLVELGTKLLRDKTITDIRIVPNYLAMISTFDIVMDDPHGWLKHLGNHSGYSTNHLVYVKRKKR